VEYSLTNLGKSLTPMLEEIAKWGRQTGEKFGTIEAVE